MPIAVALILLVVGSLVFHFVSPWYLTPLASNWSLIDTTIDITLVVTGKAITPVPLLAHGLNFHTVVRHVHELAPHDQAGSEHRGDTDRRDDG